jgi:hypothetical protein
MIIRCPNCDRVGNLPDHLAPAAQILRCRRCSSRFLAGAVVVPGSDQRAGSAIEPPALSRSAEKAPFLTDGFFAGFDEPQSALRPLGPGDSQYELSFTLEEPRIDPDGDWPEGSDDARPDEDPSGEVAVPLGLDPSPPEPRILRLIAAWGQPFLFGASILAVLSLPLFGFLLVRGLDGRPADILTTLVLVVGSVASITMMLISLSLLALNILLVDLARNIRRLRDHADREAGIGRQ